MPSALSGRCPDRSSDGRGAHVDHVAPFGTMGSLFAQLTRYPAVPPLLLLSASGAGGMACSAVGVAQGVQVDFPQVLESQDSSGLDVQVCFGDGHCQTLRHVSSPQLWSGQIPNGEPVQVRVRIARPGGREAELSSRVTPTSLL